MQDDAAQVSKMKMDKAKKTMGKKDKRVQEITSLLAEEITPKLDTLRAEKRSFIQWQKACSELERIGRLLRAWEWTEAKARAQAKEDEKEARNPAMRHPCGRTTERPSEDEQLFRSTRSFPPSPSCDPPYAPLYRRPNSAAVMSPLRRFSRG